MCRWYSNAIGFIILIVLSSLPARAQSAKDSTTHFCRSAVYVELGGSAELYSLNYDYRFTKEIGFRLGFTAWSITTGFPIMAEYLVGGRVHHLEIGVGAVVGFVSTVEGKSFLANGPSTGGSVMWWMGTLGYRYQPDQGGFVFRIDYTPLLEHKRTYSWGGISLGYAF